MDPYDVTEQVGSHILILPYKASSVVAQLLYLLVMGWGFLYAYKHVIDNTVATTSTSDFGKYSCMNKMMSLHMFSNYLHIAIASYT